MANSRSCRIAMILLACAVAAIASAVEISAQEVAILTTDSLLSTRRSISGATKIIHRSHSAANLTLYLLPANADSCAQQIAAIKAANPDVILTIGSSATVTARDSFSQTPIVFSSVLYPVISGFVESISKPGKNITGASLNIEVGIQFRKFLQIVPKMKTIGVLYSPNTALLIPSSRVVARQLGMKLLALEVNDQKDLAKAFDSLARACDGLWSVADPNLFSPQSTKFIILNTIRHGIPFMGFSRYVVESGALFALDFDYKAVGQQAGTSVSRILDGTDPGDIPVTSPDIIWFHYNEKTAQHVNVTIPEEMIAIAKEVYR